MKTAIALVGPVYPYRAGIAYCTTRLAQELGDVRIVSFKRQYPKRFYPGKDDIDETLRDRTPANATFDLDILNPLTWIAAGLQLRKFDSVIFVWWIWVWALPYLVILALLRRRTTVVLQCHNIGDKEPAKWKSWLANRVLRRGDVLVVHAETELLNAIGRAGGKRIVKARLPVHELGGAIENRHEAKVKLGLTGRDVALFFGHVRPFKGLDIALRAWPKLRSDVVLLVAGEAWWEGEREYRSLADELGLAVCRLPFAGDDRFSADGKRQTATAHPAVMFHFAFIPDSEIATLFAAADVVLAPYRIEAQSGVALTAFHFGRPVIASRAGGLPELVRDGINGSLVPVEDPDALARAVDGFFTTADRARLEQGAAEAAKSNSWEDYGNLFRRLVTRP